MKLKRPRGRPPVDPSARLSTPVQVRLALRQYDLLSKRAAQVRCTVPALIRAAIFRYQE